MFIRVVDQSIENLLRATLPMPADAGDVAFDAPTVAWSAGLTRPTVSLFLYDMAPSPHTAGTVLRRVDANGRSERRPPPPVMQLGYLVSAWAGSALEEHELLGNVLNRLAGIGKLPVEYLAGELSSNPVLTVGEDHNNWLRQIWHAAGGALKGSFTFQVTVAADAAEWSPEAPAPSVVVPSVNRLGSK